MLHEGLLDLPCSVDDCFCRLNSSLHGGENICGFLEDVAGCLEPEGIILIVDDEITVIDEMLPSGLNISEKGEFNSNNDTIDRYFILEKKTDV